MRTLMGNADAMSRRGNKSDYYIAPWQCVQGLREKKAIKSGSPSILDPCAGTGVIGRILRENMYTGITEEDILYDGQDFLKREYLDKFDYVIANPPYSIQNAFIDKAMEIA